LLHIVFLPWLIQLMADRSRTLRWYKRALRVVNKTISFPVANRTYKLMHHHTVRLVQNSPLITLFIGLFKPDEKVRFLPLFNKTSKGAIVDNLD